MVKGVQVEEYITRRRNYIKNSYAQLLLYYYKKGVGKVSEIAGVTITDKLINTIERRFKQLGGDPALIKLRGYMPSNNGQLKQ